MNRELIFCIQRGDLGAIKDLIAKGFDIKPELQNALNYAVNGSNIKIVQYFVELGADVTDNNSHALLGASLIKSPYFGNLEVIDYLVQKGADINVIKDTRHPIVREWLDNYLAIVDSKID